MIKKARDHFKFQDTKECSVCRVDDQRIIFLEVLHTMSCHLNFEISIIFIKFGNDLNPRIALVLLKIYLKWWYLKHFPMSCVVILVIRLCSWRAIR